MKAAWFREWKTNRAWLLVAGLLMVISPIIHILTVAASSVSSQPLAWYWRVLLPAVYLYPTSSPSTLPPVSSIDVVSGPPISMAYVIIAACLGGVLWGNDRAHGWSHTLMGPLPRRLILSIKMRLGLLFLLVPFTAIAAVLFVVNVLTGDIMNPKLLIGWWAIRLVGLFAGFATGFLFAAVMAWWQPSTLLALVALAFPWIFGSFIYQVLGGWNSPSSSLGTKAKNVFQFISPMGMAGTYTTSSGTGQGAAGQGAALVTYSVGVAYGQYAYLHYLLLVVWGGVALVAAHLAFQNEPLENQSSLFIVPAFAKVGLPFLSFLPAYLLARNASQANGGGPPDQLALFVFTLVFTGVIWGLFTFVRKWRNKGWRREG